MSTNNRRVAYVWEENLIEYCDRLPAVVGRASLVHSLITAYGLLNYLKVVRSKEATYNELKLFHSDLYLDHLKTFGEIEDDYMPTAEDEEYGLGYDCPPVSDMYNALATIAGSSVTAAKCLLLNIADVAINWCGGWHHAHRFGAEGFCYVNDIVIAIEKLRLKYPDILYVDLDVHHGNGVQDAYNLSKSVFTLSFHKCEPGFYPGTGYVEEVGTLKGKGYMCNFPLQAFYSDETFEYVFDKRSTDHIPPLKKPDGNWTRNPSEKSGLFAQFLQGVFKPNDPDPSPPEDEIDTVTESDQQMSLPLRPVTPREVRKQINNLKSKKAPGYDLITAEVLKELPRKGMVLINVFTMVYSCFMPDAIVVQCGADALAHDPIGGAGLTTKGYCSCIQKILDKRKPTLLLGGGGYNHTNAAKLWTTITGLVTGIELDETIPEHTFWPKYGPDYSLSVQPLLSKDANTREIILYNISVVKENLRTYLHPEDTVEPLVKKLRTDEDYDSNHIKPQIMLKCKLDSNNEAEAVDVHYKLPDKPIDVYEFFD